MSRTMHTLYLKNTTYNIRKIDGTNWFYVNKDSNLVTVYKSLVGAKKYISRKTNIEYRDLSFITESVSVK